MEVKPDPSAEGERHRLLPDPRRHRFETRRQRVAEAVMAEQQRVAFDEDALLLEEESDEEPMLEEPMLADFVDDDFNDDLMVDEAA
jgi:hypothetical protein